MPIHASRPPDLLVRRFHRTSDLYHIRNWLNARELNISLSENLPEIGFIAFDHNESIAAGFLRKVEGNFGLIDGLITNPTAQSHARHFAIDEIVQNIILVAKELHFSLIMAFTIDNGTLIRSRAHGFQALPDTMIVKNL